MSSLSSDETENETIFGQILDSFNSKNNRVGHEIAHIWADESKAAYVILQSQAELQLAFEDKKIKITQSLKLLLMHVIQEPLMQSQKEISSTFKQILFNWLRSKFNESKHKDNAVASEEVTGKRIYDYCQYMLAIFTVSYRQTRQSIDDSSLPIGSLTEDVVVVVVPEQEMVTSSNAIANNAIQFIDFTLCDESTTIPLMTKNKCNNQKSLAKLLTNHVTANKYETITFPSKNVITSKDMDTVRKSIGLFLNEKLQLYATKQIPEGTFLGTVQGTYYCTKSILTNDNNLVIPQFTDSLNEFVFATSDGFVRFENLNIFKFSDSLVGNIKCTASGIIVSCRYIIPGCLLNITTPSKFITKLKYVVQSFITMNSRQTNEIRNYERSFQRLQELEAEQRNKKNKKKRGNKNTMNKSKKAKNNEVCEKSDDEEEEDDEESDDKEEEDDEESDDKGAKKSTSKSAGNTLLIDVLYLYGNKIHDSSFLTYRSGPR